MRGAGGAGEPVAKARSRVRALFRYYSLSPHRHHARVCVAFVPAFVCCVRPPVAYVPLLRSPPGTFIPVLRSSPCSCLLLYYTGAVDGAGHCRPLEARIVCLCAASFCARMTVGSVGKSGDAHQKLMHERYGCALWPPIAVVQVVTALPAAGAHSRRRMATLTSARCARAPCARSAFEPWRVQALAKDFNWALNLRQPPWQVWWGVAGAALEGGLF